MNKPMIDKPDEEVLCIAEGYRVYDLTIEFSKSCMIVHWVAEHGFGEFAYRGGYLDTEFMGEEFCIDIITYLFKEADKDYE